MRSRVRVIVLSRCVVQAHERKANVIPHRRHYTVNTALTDRAYSPYSTTLRLCHGPDMNTNKCEVDDRGSGDMGTQSHGYGKGRKTRGGRHAEVLEEQATSNHVSALNNQQGR